jgi:transposase
VSSRTARAIQRNNPVSKNQTQKKKKKKKKRKEKEKKEKEKKRMSKSGLKLRLSDVKASMPKVMLPITWAVCDLWKAASPSKDTVVGGLGKTRH